MSIVATDSILHDHIFRGLSQKSTMFNCTKYCYLYERSDSDTLQPLYSYAFSDCGAWKMFNVIPMTLSHDLKSFIVIKSIDIIGFYFRKKLIQHLKEYVKTFCCLTNHALWQILKDDKNIPWKMPCRRLGVLFEDSPIVLNTIPILRAFRLPSVCTLPLQ